ncbi:MAG: Ig-like domain-containing protein, partial [Candidatus Bathyarchaeota archaeon]|nr:Ig-like domain-containing protein [Candidatus Bathyarchaeota archaeon]
MKRQRVMLILLLSLILSDLSLLPSHLLRAEALPDLTPSSLSLNPTQPEVGKDLTLSFMVTNKGSAASEECYGALFVGDSLETAVTIPRISPGASGVATVMWVPFIQGVYRITFIVDYWGSISESNLNNNQLVVEITASQSRSPTLKITTGPSVVEVTQTSVTIYWETSVGSYGWVEYDEVAGLFRYKETDDVFSQTHLIKLADLKPSSTYHFTAFIDDNYGNTIQSKDSIFQTLPLADTVLPHVSLIDPGKYQGITKISAEALDNVGVDRVAFYIDDKLLFIDYSSPFEFSLDTTTYENREHRLSVEAFDFSGTSASEHYNIKIYNVVDEAKPTVIIDNPKPGDTVTGKTKVTTTLSDDAGLTKVYLKVDGVTEAYAGLPDRPKSLTLSFEWDTRYSQNGSHRLAVEAWDIGRNQVFATCDLNVYNPPNSIPPKLQVTDRMVTRHGNYFEVSLTVENVGGSEARGVVITDYLTGFQPISRSDKYADYLVGFSTWTNRGECQIVSKVPIPAEQSVEYIFEAVPILLPPHPPGIYYTPTIGNSSITYKGVDSTDYSDSSNDPALYTTGGEFIETAYSNALKASDYLIITAPARLFQFNNHGDVDQLLSTMAQLARYKFGVLGYAVFPYYTNQDIQSLITYGGPWSSVLRSGWASDGYLLIVGEEEIIPAWYRQLGSFWTTSGTLNYIVNTDYPYASTIGDETVPELSIARIIGDNAALLEKVIDTSINVYLGVPGYGFDGSNLLLAAGYPSGMGGNDAYMDFPEAVTDASSIFSRKNPNSVQTLFDASDYTQYIILEDGTRSINETKTRDLIGSAFFAAAINQDLIYLAGHGDPYIWDQIAYWKIWSQPKPFGSSSPVIFASSCNVGAYDGWWSHSGGKDVFVPEVTGMAEVCLQKGAAVYLGSLNSAGWAPYSNKFFELWGMNHSVARSVRDLKRSLGDDDRDIMWKGCYQVYGDAKFGAVGYPTTHVSYSKQMTQQDASSTINVEVPDYVVSRVNGEDHIEIPGGHEYLEVGKPLVPCYKVFYDYPKGAQIQGVTLTERSIPVTASGINVPKANISLPFIGYLVPSEESHDLGWWPVNEYEWSVIENPENMTLAITVYPIQYNSQTTEIKFYKSYRFDINYTVSQVELTGVKMNKRVYEVDEPVNVDVEVSNVGDEGVDVVVNSGITREGNDEAVSGLPLRTLNDLKGKASYSTRLDTKGFDHGYYSIVTELRDTKGNLLDKRTEGFRIGDPHGEIVSLTLDPEGFKIGERVDVKIMFQNTGNINLTGGTVTRIYNSHGDIINEFSHP